MGDVGLATRTFTDSGAELRLDLRVGCLNVRGIKSNHHYVNDLLDELDICAISEHWLHNYDLRYLKELNTKFNVLSSAPPPIEDTVTCTPRYVRGSGGVAIF